MSLKSEIARRPLLASLLGVAGLAIVGGGVYEDMQNSALRYPKTPYDDLLYKLPDRQSAKALGSQVLVQWKTFDVEATAQTLRARLKDANLADVLETEIRDGQVMELRGWVLPQDLAAICALAAKVG